MLTEVCYAVYNSKMPQASDIFGAYFESHLLAC